MCGSRCTRCAPCSNVSVSRFHKRLLSPARPAACAWHGNYVDAWPCCLLPPLLHQHVGFASPRTRLASPRFSRPQVQEFFGDWVALEGHHFLVPLQRPHLALQPFAWDFGNSSDAIARMTEGVAALMLSLRRRFLVR